MTPEAKAPILHKYLAEGSNHPPARTLTDVVIDPPCSHGAQKRRRSDMEGTDNQHESADSTDSLDRAVQVFLSSGCCVLPNALPANFVQKCKEKADKDLKLLDRELQCRLEEAAESGDSTKLASALRVDYREMVDRDGLRRDVRFELERFPYSAPGLVYNRRVFPLIKELLGGDDRVNLLYAGVMWARRCSPSDDEETKQSQKWHADGGHCFEHAHQPPHIVNVFFPLIDVSSEHGPTEARPGSHRLGKFDDPSLASFGLEGKAGDAILFDYRLKHRGGINVSKDKDRPILYLAYAKPWFRDAGNTRAGTSIFKDPRQSAPWISRLLTGEAMDKMEGFDDISVPSNGLAVASGLDGTAGTGNSAIEEGNARGSGERWVLFKMNVQLEDDREETIVVHSGDIALEVATHFCRKHQLSNDFITVLAEAIQQQIDQATKP